MKIKLKEILNEPVTIVEMATAIRLDSYSNDEIESLIKSGREAAENYTRTDFATKKYHLIFNDFTNEVIVPFENFLKLESVKFNKKDGTTDDVTANYKAYIEEGIIVLKSNYDYSQIDEYGGLVFEIIVGFEGVGVPEKVKEAIKWFGVNIYFKQPATEWYESFKNLLREIRITTA